MIGDSPSGFLASSTDGSSPMIRSSASMSPCSMAAKKSFKDMQTLLPIRRLAGRRRGRSAGLYLFFQFRYSGSAVMWPQVAAERTRT